MEYRWMIESEGKTSATEIRFRLDGVIVSTEAFAQWIRELKTELEQKNLQISAYEKRIPELCAEYLKKLEESNRLYRELRARVEAVDLATRSPEGEGRMWSDAGEKAVTELLKDFAVKRKGVTVVVGPDGEVCCADCGKKDYPLEHHKCERMSK